MKNGTGRGMVLSTIVLASLLSTSCAELKRANDDQSTRQRSTQNTDDAAKQLETLKLKRYELAYRLYLAHAELKRHPGPIPSPPPKSLNEYTNYATASTI